MNTSDHQRCSEKCDSSAQGYSKRGVPYMVPAVAALLKQSTLKVTPLIKRCVYSNVCSNNIHEHYSQILLKCVCYILRFLGTSDFLHMLALFFTFGNSTVCTFYHYHEHSSCHRTCWWIQGFYGTKMLCTGR
jgi:hypothetical protein